VVLIEPPSILSLGLTPFVSFSKELNVDPKIDTTGGSTGGNEGEGDDVNTRFISTGNTAIDTFIGAAAGTVAANLAGGLFNGYREKCRFKRQAVDTKTAGGEDVDTRLFCLNDLLPRPVDCNRCNCYENSCRDCYQCRQPDCYRCDCYNRDCRNYCNKCSRSNSGSSRPEPWSSSNSGGSSYRPSSSGGSSYRPSSSGSSYRPSSSGGSSYRPSTGWRNGGEGDSPSSSSGSDGVTFA